MSDQKPQRYVLGPAYQPGPDPAIKTGVDGYRDYATQDEIEKAAWWFQRNHPTVGLLHEDGTEGSGEVVESYIWRGPDWHVEGHPVVKTGTWMVGAILDPETWRLVEDGKIDGWSVQGAARRFAAKD